MRHGFTNGFSFMFRAFRQITSVFRTAASLNLTAKLRGLPFNVWATQFAPQTCARTVSLLSGAGAPRPAATHDPDGRRTIYSYDGLYLLLYTHVYNTYKRRTKKHAQKTINVCWLLVSHNGSPIFTCPVFTASNKQVLRERNAQPHPGLSPVSPRPRHNSVQACTPNARSRALFLVGMFAASG